VREWQTPIALERTQIAGGRRLQQPPLRSPAPKTRSARGQCLELDATERSFASRAARTRSDPDRLDDALGNVELRGSSAELRRSELPKTRDEERIASVTWWTRARIGALRRVSREASSRRPLPPRRARKRQDTVLSASFLNGADSAMSTPPSVSGACRARRWSPRAALARGTGETERRGVRGVEISRTSTSTAAELPARSVATASNTRKRSALLRAPAAPGRIPFRIGVRRHRGTEIAEPDSRNQPLDHAASSGSVPRVELEHPAQDLNPGPQLRRPSSSQDRPQTTRAPPASAPRAKTSTSRVLPTPASPPTRRTRTSRAALSRLAPAPRAVLAPDERLLPLSQGIAERSRRREERGGSALGMVAGGFGSLETSATNRTRARGWSG